MKGKAAQQYVVRRTSLLVVTIKSCQTRSAAGFGQTTPSLETSMGGNSLARRQGAELKRRQAGWRSMAETAVAGWSRGPTVRGTSDTIVATRPEFEHSTAERLESTG
eukprot:TRINITY_DN28294_c0_g1_i1.p2 TRINITY_DN28294_c0_g1~~TRINITY_DN28294_c0_g1_i1.p2  ORF type:complete len:116 (-),score=1.57 TRINITY_DN28294_c0_g1_i1:146-466(-)